MFDGGNVVFNVDTVGDIENIDTLHEKYHLNSYEGFSYNNVEYNVHEAFYYILYPFGKLEKYLNQEFTPTIDSTYNDLDILTTYGGGFEGINNAGLNRIYFFLRNIIGGSHNMGSFGDPFLNWFLNS